MLERIEALRQFVITSPRMLSLERALLYKESMESSAGQPESVRRARAFAHAVSKMDIAIYPGEMIVGGRTVQPRAGVISPDLGVDWLADELDSIPLRRADPFYVSEQQKRTCREVLFPYYRGRDMHAFLESTMRDELRLPRDARVFRLNQTDKGQGHVLPDYAIILARGLGATIDALAEQSARRPENDFYRAALITCKAAQHLVDRYARLALEQARWEPDMARKAELQSIADCLSAIREKQPTTFHQALQLFWLTCVALQVESNASSISIGRFDQFMLPFFVRDLETDRLTYEQAHLLMSCLWIKMNEVVFVRSADSAQYFGGFPSGYNMVLGGLTPEGGDGTNQLSYLCLDVTASLRLPQPNLSVRVHQSTPTSFLRKSSELIAQGFGMPQVFNDDAIVDTLVRKGVSRLDARNYGIVGCVQLSIPGCMYGMPDVVLFNLLKCLELVIHRGFDPVSGRRFPVQLLGDYTGSFEDFERSVLATIRQYVGWACEAASLVDLAQRRFAPVPFLSTLMAGCVESGLDMTQGGTRYNGTGVQQIGIANLADSMLVIREAVFEQRLLGLDALSRLLQDNYAGQEALRQSFIHDHAKYGNNIDRVDTLASHYLSQFCTFVSENTNPRGGRFSPGSYTVSAHIPMGRSVGATPDGRSSGTKLADGGLAPESGFARLGPVALLNTVSRLDSELLSNGSLLNLRFSAASFRREDAFERFFSLLKLFIRLKLLHIQFSVTDADQLRQAQACPDSFPELLVRVAGYTAYFNDLGREVQDDIIDRCAHNMELTHE